MTGRSRRPAEPVGTSRERILDAAERLFAATGYDGTPTARIAASAAVPKGLLFHYFPTKIDVLVALMVERAHLERLRRIPLDPVSGDVAQTLTRLAERFDDAAHLSPALRRILFREARTHPEVRRRLTQLHTEALNRVRAAIDAALDGAVSVAGPHPHRDSAAAAFASALLHDLHLNQDTGGRIDLGGIASLIARGLQLGAIGA